MNAVIKIRNETLKSIADQSRQNAYKRYEIDILGSLDLAAPAHFASKGYVRLVKRLRNEGFLSSESGELTDFDKIISLGRKINDVDSLDAFQTESWEHAFHAQPRDKVVSIVQALDKKAVFEMLAAQHIVASYYFYQAAVLNCRLLAHLDQYSEGEIDPLSALLINEVDSKARDSNALLRLNYATSPAEFLEYTRERCKSSYVNTTISHLENVIFQSAIPKYKSFDL